MEKNINASYLLKKTAIALIAKTMDRGSIFGAMDEANYFPGTSPGKPVEYVMDPAPVVWAGWVAEDVTLTVLWLGRGWFMDANIARL